VGWRHLPLTIGPTLPAERGFAACARVGVSPNYFVGRYLMGDKSIPFRENVDAADRELRR
jgi:hypothetical protein